MAVQRCQVQSLIKTAVVQVILNWHFKLSKLYLDGVYCQIIASSSGIQIFISRNGKVICQILFVDVCTFLCCSCYCCCCCCSCCFKNRGITQHVLITFHVWIKLCFRSVLARQVTRSALRLLVQPPAQGLKEPVIFNGSV